MTRFARSKTSKGSNVRVPESGTPWEVMKKQLESSQRAVLEVGDRTKAEEQRVKNYEEFLKDEKKKNLKRSWCEFPDPNDQIKSKKKKKLNGKHESAVTADGSDSVKKKINIKKSQKKRDGVKKSISDVAVSKDSNVGRGDSNDDIAENNVANRIEQSKNNDQNISNNKTGTIDTAKLTRMREKKKLRKIMQKLKKKSLEPKLSKGVAILKDGNDNLDKKIENEDAEKKSKKENVPNKSKKLKKKNLEAKSSTENIEKDGKVIEKVKKKSPPNRRKPVGSKSFKLSVNGEEMELVRFDGFPVLADDAKRLRELNDAMKSKGIPKSEILRTMKLERRRAEKHLARVKKLVCFNCRISGHLLSDCPELSKNAGGMPMTGLCFKCGSTEHKSFECKVQKGDDFKFSKCFICKEQGHIARQCPDHPKGLYPKGGACKLCGDVTHFKKDCPTTLEKKEDNKMTLDTFENSVNLEEIEHKTEVKAKKEKKTKVISF